MKQILFTILLLVVVGMFSCRKNTAEPNIKQYDDQQIQNYISANGITGMKRDTVGGDTTGIYYQVINEGSGAVLDYPLAISYVYTLKSFDNKYSATDTVADHFYGVLGHLAPKGLVLAIRNDMKRAGAKMRLLIPSHLAYGLAGAGSGSSTLTNGRIAGNQCLDYTVHVVADQSKYDDMVIQQYMTANSLTGYTKITAGVDSGLYYKITTVGTGSTINNNTSGSFNDVGKLMNNTTFDDHSSTTLPFYDLAGASNGSVIEGVAAGLRMSRGGGAFSVLIPSRLGYGASGVTGAIAPNSCLRFDVTNIVVNP